MAQIGLQGGWGGKCQDKQGVRRSFLKKVTEDKLDRTRLAVIIVRGGSNNELPDLRGREICSVGSDRGYGICVSRSMVVGREARRRWGVTGTTIHASRQRNHSYGQTVGWSIYETR